MVEVEDKRTQLHQIPLIDILVCGTLCTIAHHPDPPSNQSAAPRTVLKTVSFTLEFLICGVHSTPLERVVYSSDPTAIK